MARGAKKDPAPHVGIPLGDHIEEYLIPAKFDADGVQATSALGVDGREYPDPVPMSPPVGYVEPHDLMWMLNNMMERGRAALDAAQVETEEEANDFDIEDDPLDPLTPYEKVFLPETPAATSGAAPGGAAPVSPSTPSASPGSGSVGSTSRSRSPDSSETTSSVSVGVGSTQG